MIKVFERDGEILYQRWNIHQRLQHIIMFVAFILCCFTGLPIKYHHHGWAQVIVDLFGGFDTMLNWHLVGATGVLVATFYMVGWQIYCLIRGKAGWGIVPSAYTGKSLVAHFKYCLGFSEETARFDRYSYKEMFDYWAVGWGMIAIGATGLLMWFPEWSNSFLPRWIVDCGRIAHSDEAILAIFVIVVWHFYNVHFCPEFFPMSKVWYTGTMTEEVMAHEHPVELEKIKQAMGTQTAVEVTDSSTNVTDSSTNLKG